MAAIKKTKVCIIGSGPAGLLLSQLLHNSGIDSILIDRQSREHIEARIRAGVLEWGSVTALEEAGVGERMHREGLPHSGIEIAFDGEFHRIDLKELAGKQVMVYGQTELTKDLIDLRLEQGAEIYFGAENVKPQNVESDAPEVVFELEGNHHTVVCDYIAGCDGFHGVSRSVIPDNKLKTFERVYPFGWLGILVDKKPLSEELIYANHSNGFALASMRSETRSRYYVQCSLEDSVDDWPDDRFWEEFSRRLGPEASANLETGNSFEKSIAPLRSFVAEPIRHGNLFLAGDAAHIVPPTGAKGLNLAIADVTMLSRALAEKINNNNEKWLEAYSEACLKRIWKVERFSWWMSMMLHQFPDFSPFEKRMQRAEFDYLVSSEAASKALAENYVGLPLEF